jgi:hypothetical protein
MVLVLVLMFCRTTEGQNPQGDNPGAQSNTPEILQDLDVRQDPRLTWLIGLHIRNNEKMNKTSGYRVEIFFSSALDARQKALQTKTTFLRDYPDINVYVLYVSPDFKVRVGDFRTKNEALELMKKIQGRFPKAFIVPDNIEYPSLN